MTIYKKIATARTKLQSMPLKKSGHNKFAGYNYFELGDFLPACNDIFAELGLCDVISFGTELATLTVYDTETSESVVFSSPMASANLKGCHDIQNLGASQTYLRRYLWQTTMGMVEHDALDASKPDQPSREEICAKAVEAHIDSLQYIRKMLSDATSENVALAKEAFGEIPDTDQRAMWVAPTKCSTAFLTTEERRLLKGA